MALLLSGRCFLLKKTYRLRKNIDFRSIYAKKDSVAADTVILYVKENNSNDALSVGFSVSKKIGKATIRNRCKRLMREVVRNNLQNICRGMDYVLIGRAPLKTAAYGKVQKDLQYVLRRKKCLRSIEGPQ